MDQVLIFDTTLRDGSQMPGVSFSAQDKIIIAKKLDEIGINFVEGGWPGSNPKDIHFFELAKKETWKNTKICAFGSTHYKKFSADRDPNLQAILDSGVSVAAIFGKSSQFHAEKILGVSCLENLKMIENSIKFLKKNKIRVIFDAEHFFDGFFENKNFSLDCLRAAESGGAENISLADTNGGMLPEQITEAVLEVKKILKSATIGIHVHNDGDLAVANSLAAVDAGVKLVQGTINGIGERTGNANLCSIIPNLQIKKNKKILTAKNLSKLTEISNLVQELCNLRGRKDLPFVGKWSFRHKGGIHVSAILKNPKSYEHINPAQVGNFSEFSVSELSGRANIAEFLKKIKISTSPEKISQFLQIIKNKENEGISFEAGEASLEILARKFFEEKKLPFEILKFFVKSEKEPSNLKINKKKFLEDSVEATIFLKINNDSFHTAGFGNGPVNAIDQAMRKTLEKKFTVTKNFQLVDFKVRIVDISLGTSAKTRVQIETLDQNSGKIWNTVGCHQNIIFASVQALSDSFVFGIWNQKK